jgi:signal transduction histidine kinase
MGEIDVALRRPRTDVEYKSALDRLRGQTLELHQMVEALLFLARAEPDRNLPGVETKDCRTWLELYSERWGDNPRWKDLSFSANEGLVVATSWPLVAQLLDILIDNALKYSPAGTRVRVTMSRSFESLLIDVVDHGEGIDPKDHEAIFDPFIRTEEARRSGVAGTGLGLAICKGIVQALHGTIELASEAGKGSHFRIEIAAAESEELDGTSTTTGRHSSRTTTTESAAASTISP